MKKWLFLLCTVACLWACGGDDEKKSKLEKNIIKMKENYQKEGKSILRELGDEFKFTKAVEEY